MLDFSISPDEEKIEGPSLRLRKAPTQQEIQAIKMASTTNTTAAFIEKVKNAEIEKRKAKIAKAAAFYANIVVTHIKKSLNEKGTLPTSCTVTSSLINTIYNKSAETFTIAIVSAIPAILKETFSDAEFSITFEIENVYACKALNLLHGYRASFTITPTWPPM